MNDTIREKARIGLSILKESILDALYEAHLNNDKCVRLKTVRESIDMPEAESGNPSDEWGSATTRFMLLLLLQEEYVERCPLSPTSTREGWRLTNKGKQEIESR